MKELEIDIPEEVQKTKSLYDHPNKRPLHKNEDYPAQETRCATNLLLPCKKVECLLGTNN